MTTFMKIETATYFILKFIGYISGFVGAFMVIGVAGNLELDLITIGQFWLHEFCAFCLIGLSFIVYYLREAIKKDYCMRCHRMKRKTVKAY